MVTVPQRNNIEIISIRSCQKNSKIIGFRTTVYKINDLRIKNLQKIKSNGVFKEITFKSPENFSVNLLAYS